MIRNRRYARLQELLADGAYFSDEEMKKRQPKLHYQMIGLPIPVFAIHFLLFRIGTSDAVLIRF